MQAKDVPEVEIMRMIPHQSDERLGISRWDIERQFPTIPPKVLLSKLRQLVKRGKIIGCTCGCRGDFHLPWQEGQ